MCFQLCQTIFPEDKQTNKQNSKVRLWAYAELCVALVLASATMALEPMMGGSPLPTTCIKCDIHVATV